MSNHCQVTFRIPTVGGFLLQCNYLTDHHPDDNHYDAELDLIWKGLANE